MEVKVQAKAALFKAMRLAQLRSGPRSSEEDSRNNKTSGADSDDSGHSAGTASTAGTFVFTPRGGQEGSSSATVVHFDADAHPERAQELLLSVFDAVTYVQYLCRVIKEPDLDNVHKQHRHEAKALRGKVSALPDTDSRRGSSALKSAEASISTAMKFKRTHESSLLPPEARAPGLNPWLGAVAMCMRPVRYARVTVRRCARRASRRVKKAQAAQAAANVANATAMAAAKLKKMNSRRRLRELIAANSDAGDAADNEQSSPEDTAPESPLAAQDSKTSDHDMPRVTHAKVASSRLGKRARARRLRNAAAAAAYDTEPARQGGSPAKRGSARALEVAAETYAGAPGSPQLPAASKNARRLVSEWSSIVKAKLMVRRMVRRSRKRLAERRRAAMPSSDSDDRDERQDRLGPVGVHNAVLRGPRAGPFGVPRTRMPPRKRSIEVLASGNEMSSSDCTPDDGSGDESAGKDSSATPSRRRRRKGKKGKKSKKGKKPGVQRAETDTETKPGKVSAIEGLRRRVARASASSHKSGKSNYSVKSEGFRRKPRSKTISIAESTDMESDGGLLSPRPRDAAVVARLAGRKPSVQRHSLAGVAAPQVEQSPLKVHLTWLRDATSALRQEEQRASQAEKAAKDLEVRAPCVCVCVCVWLCVAVCVCVCVWLWLCGCGCSLPWRVSVQGKYAQELARTMDQHSAELEAAKTEAESRMNELEKVKLRLAELEKQKRLEARLQQVEQDGQELLQGLLVRRCQQVMYTMQAVGRFTHTLVLLFARRPSCVHRHAETRQRGHGGGAGKATGPRARREQGTPRSRGHGSSPGRACREDSGAWWCREPEAALRQHRQRGEHRLRRAICDATVAWPVHAAPAPVGSHAVWLQHAVAAAGCPKPAGGRP